MLLVWAIVSVAAKSKKTAGGAQGANARKEAATQTKQAPQASHKTKQEHRKSATKTSMGEGRPGQIAEGMSGFTTITHRLDTSMRYTEYVGSLGSGSTEGEDVCDPSLQHGESSLEDELNPIYATAISTQEPMLDLSKKGLLQGIVMSEILTRPAQRKRGHR